MKNKIDIPALAKKMGICKRWHKGMLNDGTFKNLCAMYFAGSDWSMENDFPNEALAREIKYETAEYGLLTDFVGEIIMPNSPHENEKAFLGKSNVSLKLEEYSASNIILRHNTEAEITASGYAFAIVNVLDNSKVLIDAENSKGVISVYAYGSLDNIKVLRGEVKIYKANFDE